MNHPGEPDNPSFTLRPFGPGDDDTSAVAVGDMDGDGDLDIVVGNAGEQTKVYLNRLTGAAGLTNNPASVVITRPASIPNANFYSTAEILSQQFISISYTLSDLEGDPARFIRACYSLDGGGNWQLALQDGDPPPSSEDIKQAGSGCPYVPGEGSTDTLAASPGGTTYTFVWDTFASGFFGRSDNVVFRIEAYPSFEPRRYAVAGPYQRPYASATTFPFRVQGTLVRVVSDDEPDGVCGALVYRLKEGSRRADPMGATTGSAYRTDVRGYLQGRGELGLNDQLVALHLSPIESYTVYRTSALPISTGLEAQEIKAAGVQTLTVSSDNPLMLFNLDIALEWDARKDEQFQSQLRFDLNRTSELLYDWTNGQVALGDVTLYHDREHWDEADIRIYATNRLRPNATTGGIVSGGQVRMGSVWNRFGDPFGNPGEDWPRALAHELGHYLFHLDDNYLGLDDEGLLIMVDTCPGAMSDPYRDDYSEFHPGHLPPEHPDADRWDWYQHCTRTLAAKTSGRWDWATITTFYPWLITETITNTGPSSLPLEVTRVQEDTPDGDPDTLEVPILFITKDGARYQPGLSARAFLFQDDRLIDLGRPTLDRVLARGARPDDRVCVYELTTEGQLLGCESIESGGERLALAPLRPDWLPDLIISPVTSRTIEIAVTNVPTGLSLQARLFPMGSAALPPVVPLTETDGYYTAILTSTASAIEGHVHVWVDETEDETHARREVITQYALGGSPGFISGEGGDWAPVISADGQVILYGQDLHFQQGEFYILQAATVMPNVPPWATVVGQGHWLTATANAPDLVGTSMSFSYLGREVPPGEERKDWLHVYFWDREMWEPLTTKVNTDYNIASAPTQGPGLYALMSSIQIHLPNAGWNLFGYPVPGTRTVAEALSSIEGRYGHIYRYDWGDADDPWRLYAPNAPDYINTLYELEFGQVYWITTTQAITLSLKGASATALVNADSGLPLPPATFYGRVLASPNAAQASTPTAGMPVQAHVDGNLCGRGETEDRNGQVVYVVHVNADNWGSSAGCGAPGRTVTFTVGSRMMVPSALWDNNKLKELLLAAWRVYLPLIVKR